MVRLVSWRDFDCGPLQAFLDHPTQHTSRVPPTHKSLPHHLHPAVSAEVSWLPRLLGVGCWAPPSYARSRIGRPNEGCEVCRFRPAATVRLPASATPTK